MNNKHGVANQLKPGVNYINSVKLSKTDVKPTWLRLNLTIELNQVGI